MAAKKTALNRGLFIKTFKLICASGFEEYKVWSAFVNLTAYNIAKACGNDVSAFDEEVASIDAKFAKHMDCLAKMFSCVVSEYEHDSNQDFLGSVYMELGISSKEKGQFFTPYTLSRMTAQLSIDKAKADEAIAERGFVTVNDPAVGGGALLIGAYNVLRDFGYNTQTQAWFVAQDISVDTALMCYIQLAILGCAGFITVGDTLSLERSFSLRLPMNIIDPLWTARLLRGEVPC